MDKQFIEKITSLRNRTKSAQKNWSNLHQRLVDLKRECDHKGADGKLSVTVQRRPYQRVCNICEEAVMGRENLSVCNSYVTPARIKRVQKLLKKVNHA